MATGKVHKPTLKVKTIWQNDYPNTGFASQNVQLLETVYQGDELIIVFKEYISYNHYYETPVRAGDTDVVLLGIPGSAGSSSGVPTVVKREFSIGTGGTGDANTAYFSEAYGAPTNGTFSQNDNNCIPIEIRKVCIE